jgi:hypothetical protein
MSSSWMRSPRWSCSSPQRKRCALPPSIPTWRCPPEDCTAPQPDPSPASLPLSARELHSRIRCWDLLRGASEQPQVPPQAAGRRGLGGHATRQRGGAPPVQRHHPGLCGRTARAAGAGTAAAAAWGAAGCCLRTRPAEAHLAPHRRAEGRSTQPTLSYSHSHGGCGMDSL